MMTSPRQESVSSLLQSGSWDQATLRAQSHPHECEPLFTPSNTRRAATPALALACRVAAPLPCIEEIIKACPKAVRAGGGLARGTPLHEAISNSRVNLNVIKFLIRIDENLSTSDTACDNNSTLCQSRKNERAALAQDVDGQTPLHLLVRRYFCFHPQDIKEEMIQTLQELISSCPEACAIPDRRDFEETPLVLALKANMYAHYDTAVAAASATYSDTSMSLSLPASNTRNRTRSTDGGESFFLISLLEERIHTITDLMLTINPTSAANSAPNLDYTPLHSAVYHGRCQETIYKLLQGHEISTTYTNKEYLETPLHFAAMRGESEQVISALVNPTSRDDPNTQVDRISWKAVEMNDKNGMTPLHWLWMRLLKEADTICSYDTNEESSSQIQPQSVDLLHLLPRLASGSVSELNTSTFNKTYYQVMKELDPPLDYRHMRALPNNYATIDSACTKAVTNILKRLVYKFHSTSVNSSTESNEILLGDLGEYDKTEAMVLLFWKKVEHLLEAAACNRFKSQNGRTKFNLVHTAAASHCCPPSILYTALSLQPTQLSILDGYGNLPLHYAAMRQTHCLQLSSSRYLTFMQNQYRDSNPYRDLPSLNTVMEENEDYENANVSSLVIIKNGISTLAQESSLPLVLAHGPPKAARTYNGECRLPLHLAIDNIIYSCASIILEDASSSPTLSALGYYWQRQSMQPLSFLRPLLKAHPDALERRDGRTKLYPFMQASAKATSILANKSITRARASSYASSSSQAQPPLYSLCMSESKDKTRIEQMESQFSLFSLNVTFRLLRECPILVNLGIPSSGSQFQSGNLKQGESFLCKDLMRDADLETPHPKRSKIEEQHA